MKKIISYWPLLLINLVLTGLFSGCLPQATEPYGIPSYSVQLPSKTIDAFTGAEYQADLVAGQIVSLHIQANQIKADFFDPQQNLVISKTASENTSFLTIPGYFVETPGTYRLVVTSLDGVSKSVDPVLSFNQVFELETISNHLNDTRDTAKDLSPLLITQPGDARYSVVGGGVTLNDNVAYYRISLDAGQIITVQLLDNDPTTPTPVILSFETADGQPLELSPSFTAPADGMYFIKVILDPRVLATPPVGYQFLLLVDTDIEQEPNNSPVNAQLHQLGKPVIGLAGPAVNVELATNPLPNTYQNSQISLGFDTDGALSSAGYRQDIQNIWTSFLSRNDPSTLVLHANGMDIAGSTLGFSTINPYPIEQSIYGLRGEWFKGQTSSGIQIDRALVLSDNKKYGYVFTSLTNLTGEDISDVILLDSFNPAPGGDTNITGDWEIVGSGVVPSHSDARLFIAGNAAGYMALISPDANTLVTLAPDGPVTPTQLIGTPQLVSNQPGDYSLNIVANIGTIQANSAVTTTQVIVMGQQVEQVRALAAEALQQIPSLDDYYRIHHKPGIYKANLYPSLYGYSNYWDEISQSQLSLTNLLQPALSVLSPDEQLINAASEPANHRAELIYSIEAEGDYIIRAGTRHTWTQEGGEYIMRVDPQLQIDQLPTDQTICAGSSARFTVAYSGNWQPEIQWQAFSGNAVDWKDLPEATSPSLTFTALPTEDGNKYRVLLKAQTPGATWTSQAATLTVNEAPVVTQSPRNLTVLENQPVHFQIVYGGRLASDLQWQFSPDQGQTWVNLTGETGSSLEFTSDITHNGYLFRVVVSNTCGSATSQPAQLTVLRPIFIPLVSKTQP